ncbi:hypothetical protein DNU06_07060 [Putridiphycobacter roseus]|uniref:PEGA domain-containing protein n=1 Tax=Putridiphycobacter roseus TaxID=2219161 RepID=A0A2W1N3H2_9FLAO|nr:hypothetical protein [Putridiphycobacter roseus]PZE17581.1 hypothetical protein DNU06_07060 [Putridiphycobacter roseus]
MKKNIFFTLILLVILMPACIKSGANFKLDQYEYAAGEQLAITNLSKSDTWLVKNSKNQIMDTLNGKHPQYTISLLTGNGEYSITLYDNSFELKRDIGAKKKFLIKTFRTTKTIIEYDEKSSALVYIDGTYFGQTDEEGTLECSIPNGVRIIDLHFGSKIISKTFTVNSTGSDYYYFY